MLQLLKHTCTACGKLVLSEQRKRIAFYKLRLLQFNYVAEAQSFNGLSDTEVIAADALLAASWRQSNPPQPSQAAAQLRDQIIKEIFTSTSACRNCKAQCIKYVRYKKLKIMQKNNSITQETQNINSDENQNIKQTSFNDYEKNKNHYNSQQQKEKEEEETDSEFERIMEVDNDEEKQRRYSQFIITPDTVRDLFLKLWEEDGKLLKLIYSSPDLFFVKKLVVTPSRLRPPQFLGKREALHPVTLHLQKIIHINNILSENMEDVEFMKHLMDMQIMVNDYIDSSQGQQSTIKGIRQTLEHKKGLIRSNIQGKRVNYAARSVISPDLCLDTSEVGIPDVFAKTLSFAESCTYLNRDLLCQLVENGPNYPGALSVKFPGQKIINLKTLTLQERMGVAKRMWQEAGGSGLNVISTGALPIVERHVLNGDPMIFNRQPTLHRNSMLVHKAHVIPGHGRSIRFHYANCAGYNSDFDGDEMNLHYTRTYEERAEALELCLNDKHYVTMTAGKPVRGLFQDSVIGAVKLCTLDTFLTHGSYTQLVWAGTSSIMKNKREILGLRTLEEKMIEARSVNQITSVSPMYAGNAIKLAGFLDVQRGNADGFAIEARKIPGFFDNSQDKSECATEVSEFVIDDEDKQIKAKNKVLKVQVLKESDETVVETLQPAILFPKILYTGKQVVSSLICSLPSGKDITMSGATALPKRFWGVHSDQEGILQIVNGEVMTGLVDKKHIASQPKSLAHVIAELNGPEAAGTFLSAFARLAQTVLQRKGISCSLEDLILSEKAQMSRKGILDEINSEQQRILLQFLKLDEKSVQNVSDVSLRQALHHQLQNDQVSSEILDRIFQAKSAEIASQIGEKCGASSLILPERNNGLALMVVSGAKGSAVNLQMMTSLLGQQSLEGKRVPKTQFGRTLPCFKPYQLGLKEGGFIGERYLSGLVPQSFFFHHQAGREGLVDTAVKTATSGYFQRCLMKNLESLSVFYDGSVRDGAGSLISAKAGGDGISPQYQELLTDFQLVKNCFQAFVQRFGTLNNLQDPQKAIDRFLKVIANVNVQDIEENDYQLKQQDQSCLRKALHFAREFRPAQFGSGDLKNQETVIELIGLIKNVQKSENSIDELFAELTGGQRFYDALNAFIAQKTFPEEKQAKLFRNICVKRLQDAQYCPGEAIGVLAAQSIGEPSTQLTLNTFHLAGHGAANVTLGIPRLKELVQIAKKDISTPLMSVQVGSIDIGQQLKQILEPKQLQDQLERLRLTQQMQGSRKILNLELVFRPDIPGGYDKYFASLSQENLQQIAAGVIDAMSHLKKLLIRQLKLLDKQQSVITESSQAKEYGKEPTKEVDSSLNDSKDESSDDSSDSESGAAPTHFSATNSEASEEESEYYEETTENSENVAQTLVKDFEGLMQSGVQRMTCSDVIFGAISTAKSTVKLQISVDSRHNLLYLTFIEQAIAAAKCAALPGIKQCFLREEKNGNIFLDVHGSNINVLKRLCRDLARTDEIYANHIHVVLETFGVEAARAILINEISTVFSKYSIAVDERHLGLLADYMTYLGGIRPCNRTGIKHIASPLQKSSFETAAVFLTAAAQAGTMDDLSSPSAAVTMGAYSTTQGTGCFELMQELQI